MAETVIKKAVCMWCHSHCSVHAYVQDGQIVKIEENKDHPRAAILRPTVMGCPRIRAAAEWLSHPARLKYPLKRAGARGEGKWRQISWDEALDELAGKLAELKSRYGAETLATFGGTGRTCDEYRFRFFNLFGSPNVVTQGHICWGINNVVSNLITGMTINKAPPPQAGITKCIFLIGANPAQADRATWYSVLRAQEAGAKLIVIDPRLSQTAEKADLWLQPRSGTDAALLLGMINLIIGEGLYDREFVNNWTYGFDALAERTEEYPLEKVASITGVTADKIAQAARMYSSLKPAWGYNKEGIEHLTNGVEALHARFILPAITGNLDIKGGQGLNPPTPQYIGEDEAALCNLLSSEQKNKQIGAERYKLLSWNGFDLIQEGVAKKWGRRISPVHHVNAHAPSIFRAMITGKPYPVRAAISAASNPLLTYGNSKLVYQALMSLDCYVAMDFWLTPSAELTDYVLPCASWLERPNFSPTSDTRYGLSGGEAVLPAVKEGEYEHRTDYAVWRGLGMRLGQKQHWPLETLEEEFSRRLAPLGLTFDQFVRERNGAIAFPSEPRSYEKSGFGTPTGKVELASTILEKMGYDPLPAYREPPESPLSTPEMTCEYPLVLTTGGRFQPMYHSEFRQVTSLRKQHPEPLAQINPQTAGGLGIADGGWIWIETPRGKIRQKCHYFDGIAPGVVHAEHGWWFPEQPVEEGLHGAFESNVNVLTSDEDEQCNPISGGWPLRALLCRVSKA